MVDALASGASVPRDVEVQVLSSVPNNIDLLGGLFCLSQLCVISLEPPRQIALQFGGASASLWLASTPSPLICTKAKGDRKISFCFGTAAA